MNERDTRLRPAMLCGGPTIAVADSSGRPFPAAYELVAVGVPWWAVMRWALVRGMISPAGLALDLEGRRN